MSQDQERRLPINDEGALRTFTQWISSHEEGIAEWLKNVRRAYREDRANVADEHRATIILMKDATGDFPARLGVLDVGGATLEDVERWSVWQDYTASGRGSNLSEEKTQGNGSKAYMYKLFSGCARMLGVKDGKLNCKGFEGPAHSKDRGFPEFLPDEASARDLPISTMNAQLTDALRPYNVRIDELPTEMQRAMAARNAFTLVEGVAPNNLYRGRVNAKDLTAKLLRHDQVTAVIEQIQIFAIHNGRLLNEGRPLQLEAIEPYPGLEQSRAIEIPESLRDANGVKQSTTLQGVRPSGRLILLTSRENMRLSKKLGPRWKLSYRANPNHPIGSKPVSDFVPGVPGADFIYGVVELSAFEPDYVEPGRKRPIDGPLVSAIDIFIGDRIRELAKEINDRRQQARDEKTLEEVQRENKILDRFKNQFLASSGPSGPGANAGGAGGQSQRGSDSNRDYGTDSDSISFQWETERTLRIGKDVVMRAEAIVRPRVLDADGRYVPSAELEWFTNDRHVFEFSGEDLGRATGKGATHIWCKVRGTAIESDRIAVEVWVVDHVLLTPRTLVIPLGRREQISAQVTNDEGERATNVMINWSHDAPDQLVVRITPWGVVTGNRLGRTAVSAGVGKDGSGGVWARILAEVTVVPNPEDQDRGGGFPKLLVTDTSDIDPITGEPRQSNPDMPTLWQEVTDYQQNIWWLNLGSPEAAYFFDRRADSRSEWRAFHAQKVIEMVIQIQMKDEYDARGDTERPDLWNRHKAQLEIFQVQMMQAMWEKLMPFIRTGGDIE